LTPLEILGLTLAFSGIRPYSFGSAKIDDPVYSNTISPCLSLEQSKTVCYRCALIEYDWAKSHRWKVMPLCWPRPAASWTRRLEVLLIRHSRKPTPSCKIRRLRLRWSRQWNMSKSLRLFTGHNRTNSTSYTCAHHSSASSLAYGVFSILSQP